MDFVAGSVSKLRNIERSVGEIEIELLERRDELAALQNKLARYQEHAEGNTMDNA